MLQLGFRHNDDIINRCIRSEPLRTRTPELHHQQMGNHDASHPYLHQLSLLNHQLPLYLLSAFRQEYDQNTI